jgi:hypothetical protein
MTVSREDLKKLIDLQVKDTAMDKLKKIAEAVPARIEEQNALLASLKQEAEGAKKNATQLQMHRKEKEIELETKETDIRKHGNELNAVKSNDAYKALLSEIEIAKQQKTLLEDEILLIMEQIDKEQAVFREKEKEFKQKENEVKSNISAIEAEFIKLQDEISVLEAERTAFAEVLNQEVLRNYDYIRGARSGQAVVPIDKNECGGCHINLRPQTVNDVIKGQDLVMCDNCSRILYKNEA